MFNRTTFIGIAVLCGFLLLSAAPFLYGGDNSDGQKTVGSENAAVSINQDDAGDQSSDKQGYPNIDIPEPVHDCGRVPQDSKCTHIYKVRNVGSAPLKLIKAKAS